MFSYEKVVWLRWPRSDFVSSSYTHRNEQGPTPSTVVVCPACADCPPRGSIYTTIMELGPQNHNGDGLLGPNSIIVVYIDPLGQIGYTWRDQMPEDNPDVESCPKPYKSLFML